MKTTLALIIGTTLLVASSAQAGGYAGKTGWNIGADAGVTRNHSNTSNLAPCTIAGAACSIDKSDSTWRIRGGYQFNENFGLEGSYVDFRKNYSGSGTLSANQDTTAWTLSAVGKAPVSQNRRLKVYGKLGASRWESKRDLQVNANPSVRVKEKGTDPVAGIGLEYDVSNQWTVRGGYDRHFNVGKFNNAISGTVEKDVDALTIGASFNF